MESSGGNQGAPFAEWMALGRSMSGWLRAHKVSFVVTTAMAAALIYLALFQFACRFQSDGFLRASRPLTEFNAQRAAFEDRSNLLRYLQSTKLVDDPNAQYLLGAIGPRLMKSQVKPVLPYSKEDLKFLMDLKNPVDASLLGFSISFASDTPQEAAARVKLMGDYLRDAMLRQALIENIHSLAGDAREQKQKLDNQLIAKRLELDEATNKLNALKAIAARYPETSRFESRQLLTSDTDGSRYLSPVMQLVGVESNLADLHIDISSLERDIAQNALRLKFYSGAEKLSSSVNSGEEMLGAFRHLQATTFKDTNLNDDQAREVINQISLLAESLETKHISNTRFISGPTVPDRRLGPSRAVLLILSLLCGVAIAVVTLLALDVVLGRKTRLATDASTTPRSLV